MIAALFITLVFSFVWGFVSALVRQVRASAADAEQDSLQRRG
jgi:hypothetical protein